MYKLIISFNVLFAMLFGSPIFGQQTEIKDDSQKQNIIQLNNILINKKKKEIRIKANLSIKEGILEYLLVGHEGKTYETVLKVYNNKPSELNFALLLIGCQPMDFEKLLNLIDSKESDGTTELLKNHKESLLDIEIINDSKNVGTEHVMKNREGTKDPLLWVYTGGFLIPDQGYAGDFELSFIGVWPDRSAPINLFAKVKNPYSGNFGFEINKDNNELKVDQEFEILIRRR